MGMNSCNHLVNNIASCMQNNEVSLGMRHSEFAQKGISAGAFYILPKLDFTNEYNSNVYKRDSSKYTPVDAYFAHFKPGVEARSDWSQHALKLSFDTDLAQSTAQGTNNNYNDIFTSLTGRLDVVRDSYLETGFSYNKLHESRGSPDQIAGITPTFFDTKIIDAFYTHKLNRLSLVTGVNAIRYDYQNVDSMDSNTPLLMSSRDRWQYAPSVRLGYKIQQQYEAYIKFIYNQIDYDGQVFSNGVAPSGNNGGSAYNRNSTGYNALTGFAFDLTNLISGDVSVGYLQRNYVDPGLSNFGGVNGFFDLKWHPTQLTTVSGKVSRDIMQTTQAGVSGIIVTGVTVNVEHELMRNIILNAGGTFMNNAYDGFVAPNVENRTDNIYAARVGAKYVVNQYLSTDLSYIYQNRDVNYEFNNYQVNQVMLNLRGQY